MDSKAKAYPSLPASLVYLSRQKGFVPCDAKTRACDNLRPLRSLLPRSLASAALFFAVVNLLGCAHGDASQKSRQQDQENELLRERVRHLERRVSDLDAQLDSISQKVAQADGASSGRSYDAVDSVDSVSSVSSSESRPYPSPQAHNDDRSAQRERLDARQPKKRRQIGMGYDVIELKQKSAPPALERSSIYDSEPAYEASSTAHGFTTSPATLSSPPASLQQGSAPASDLPVGADAQELYDWSLRAFQEKKFLPAIAGFEDILERFPEHDLSDNALYWTALAHVRRGETRLGIQVWRSLPMRFPGSPKLADSLFGMAEAHLVLGEKDIAETLFSQLIKQYPNAERVADARRALASL